MQTCAVTTDTDGFLVEGLCGEFGLVAVRVEEEVPGFMRVSKILLGKIVWSSFKWFPAVCSM